MCDLNQPLKAVRQVKNQVACKTMNGYSNVFVGVSNTNTQIHNYTTTFNILTQDTTHKIKM